MRRMTPARLRRGPSLIFNPTSSAPNKVRQWSALGVASEFSVAAAAGRGRSTTQKLTYLIKRSILCVNKCFYLHHKYYYYTYIIKIYTHMQLAVSVVTLKVILRNCVPCVLINTKYFTCAVMNLYLLCASKEIKTNKTPIPLSISLIILLDPKIINFRLASLI